MHSVLRKFSPAPIALLISSRRFWLGSSGEVSAWALSAAGIVVGIAAIFYLPLFEQLSPRPEILLFLKTLMLPRLVIHLGGFVVLLTVFRARMRGCILYWVFSLTALLWIGGSSRFSAFLLLSGFALLLTGFGSLLARRLFTESSMGWGISLAFGILACSLVSAVLCLMHLFRWWVLVPLIAILVTATHREFLRWLQAFPSRWKRLSESWSPSLALVLEGAFLIGLFLFVFATAPEMRSDAMRFYWPYLKLLKADGGFFDIPYQWSYIIPQAGLTYAGAVYLLCGGVAVRWAMVLVWLALIGIITHRSTGTDVALNAAVALITASCPVILLVSGSLMQDTFVCLTVVVFAMACLDGNEPGSTRYWTAVGALAGMAWTAKYSSLAYMLPLGCFALLRAWSSRNLRIHRLFLCLASATATAAPWLWHTWRQAGNPFFPFFLNWFPAPLWPNGVGVGNLDSFRLPAGWTNWLLWPIHMTYRTSHFLESRDGSLGLVLPILMVLALLVLWKGKFSSRALVITAVIGTFLLCLQTAYVRYWLPALWLMALGGKDGNAVLARSNVGRTGLSAIVVVLSLLPFPIAMMNNWTAPRGWPWDFYSRKLNESQYIERVYPGFHTLSREKALNQGWPKVWFTGFEAAGHLRIRPLEALMWETRLHGGTVPRAKIQYLGSTGCQYWIVNKEREDAVWLRRRGIAQFYWDESSLIAAQGSVSLFKLRPLEDALRAFDERARPGTDLVLDGGFEKGTSRKLEYWWPHNQAEWQTDPAVAKSGSGYVFVGSKGEYRQDIPLPPGVQRVELMESFRAARPGHASLVNFQIHFFGEKEQIAGASGKVVEAVDQWQDVRTTVDVPPDAVWATLFLTNKQAESGTFFDEVHLYARE